jgi:hypothetical protein
VLHRFETLLRGIFVSAAIFVRMVRQGGGAVGFADVSVIGGPRDVELLIQAFAKRRHAAVDRGPTTAAGGQEA